MSEQLTAQHSRISEAVVDAVASVRNVDPLELDPLYTVVDPDALDQLVNHGGGSRPAALEIEFTVADCDVTVVGDGSVSVTDPDGRETASTVRPTARD